MGLPGRARRRALAVRAGGRRAGPARRRGGARNSVVRGAAYRSARPGGGASIERGMPYFICPNCKRRSIDHDRREGLTLDAGRPCSSCGFGFLFELMEDYYPGPATAFVVCDQERRILAVGRGVFELTGYQENEVLGREVRKRCRSLAGRGQAPVPAVARVGRPPTRRAAQAAHPQGRHAAGHRGLLPGVRRRRRAARGARPAVVTRLDGHTSFRAQSSQRGCARDTRAAHARSTGAGSAPSPRAARA